MSGAVRGHAAQLGRSAVGRASIPFWAAGIALVATLVGTLALGGFDQAQTVPERLEAGGEVRTSLYTVSVIDAHRADEIEEEYVEAEDGEVLVVLTVRLENLAPYPIGVGSSADRVSARLVNAGEPLLELSGADPASSARVWRTDDSSGGVVLQPRVPAEAQLVWAVPVESVADGQVTLDVYDAVETRGRVILSSDAITWRRSDLAAQFTLDVAETP